MTRDELIQTARRLSAAYRLVPPAQLSRGPAGVYGGTGSGNSIDFHDFREYQPGDDLRRVDWRAYARTEQLQLKLYREEVSPIVELLPDTSLSMSAYPGKEEALVFLCAFLAGAARSGEGRPVLLLAGRRWSGSAVEEGLARLSCSGAEPPVVAVGGSATGRPVRFFLSDFLYPSGVEQILARGAAGALQLQPIFLLAQSERDPEWFGGHRLVDAEDAGTFMDIRITAQEVTRYRQRLRSHEEQLAAGALRQNGRLCALTVADCGLESADCAELVKRLLQEGVITAA